MTAEQFSFNGVLAISLNFSLFPIKVFRVEANFGISIKASVKLISKLKSLKIVEFLILSVSLFHASFIIFLEGNGIDAFWSWCLIVRGCLIKQEVEKPEGDDLTYDELKLDEIFPCGAGQVLLGYGAPPKEHNFPQPLILGRCVPNSLLATTALFRECELGCSLDNFSSIHERIRDAGMLEEGH
ncbi:hypothetical protein Tco_0679624 [Tanacetum coccineum]|uniref:Uncharacterized protein n=1 Tax=Tanacetum coccineum TaxID=301880 RepID=A0ABQ4XJ40_9ASTR